MTAEREPGRRRPGSLRSNPSLLATAFGGPVPRSSKAYMHEKELSFVIPTHRLREVGETIEEYDEHFWRNGHSVRLIVFDDSSAVNQQKYYPLLEQTRTHQPIYYVGPAEKEQFLAY